VRKSLVPICVALLSIAPAQSEEPKSNFASAREVIFAVTALVIESYCKGYKMGKSERLTQERIDMEGSDGPQWKFYLSMLDEAEDRYGLHLAKKDGCKRALADWGPDSGDPLVVREK
jgi:hypothetical protein